jgi:hypothetical protein
MYLLNCPQKEEKKKKEKSTLPKRNIEKSVCVSQQSRANPKHHGIVRNCYVTVAMALMSTSSNAWPFHSINHSSTTSSLEKKCVTKKIHLKLSGWNSTPESKISSQTNYRAGK